MDVNTLNGQSQEIRTCDHEEDGPSCRELCERYLVRMCSEEETKNFPLALVSLKRALRCVIFWLLLSAFIFGAGFTAQQVYLMRAKEYGPFVDQTGKLRMLCTAVLQCCYPVHTPPCKALGQLTEGFSAWNNTLQTHSQMLDDATKLECLELWTDVSPGFRTANHFNVSDTSSGWQSSCQEGIGQLLHCFGRLTARVVVVQQDYLHIVFVLTITRALVGGLTTLCTMGSFVLLWLRARHLHFYVEDVQTQVERYREDAKTVCEESKMGTIVPLFVETKRHVNAWGDTRDVSSSSASQNPASHKDLESSSQREPSLACSCSIASSAGAFHRGVSTVAFDGEWTALAEDANVDGIAPFLLRFTIRNGRYESPEDGSTGDLCVTGASVLLEGGILSLEHEVLIRVGKSGRVIRYKRAKR